MCEDYQREHPVPSCAVSCECASKHLALDVSSLCHVLHSHLEDMQVVLWVGYLLYMVLFEALHVIGYKADRKNEARASNCP